MTTERVGLGTTWVDVIVQPARFFSDPIETIRHKRPLLFAIIVAVFWLVASLVMPGVIAKLGIVRVGIANLLAAASMAVFFVVSHREDAWGKIKQATRLA